MIKINPILLVKCPDILGYCIFVAGIFSAGAAAAAAVEDPQIHQFEVECLGKNNSHLCEAAGDKLRYLKSFDRLIKVSTKGCELGSEQSCDQLYSDVSSRSEMDKKSARLLIENQCEKLPKICNSVGHIYENEKKYGFAIKSYFKAWSVDKKGIYPFIEYSHGSKTKAFAASFESCEKAHDQCQFFLRYMPDHPQRDKILANADVECAKEIREKSLTGATVCVDLGVLSYKNHDLKKAIDYFEKSCNSKNETACKMLPAVLSENGVKNPKMTPEVLTRSRQLLNGYLTEIK